MSQKIEKLHCCQQSNVQLVRRRVKLPFENIYPADRPTFFIVMDEDRTDTSFVRKITAFANSLIFHYLILHETFFHRALAVSCPMRAILQSRTREREVNRARPARLPRRPKPADTEGNYFGVGIYDSTSVRAQNKFQLWYWFLWKYFILLILTFLQL